MIQKCKQCGKTFELSDSEIAFFNRKGLDLPKRCESCRRQNRRKNQNNGATMPGIQQVREVDPGFRHSAPSYRQGTGSWKKQDEELPFWKQQEMQEKQAKKKNPLLAAVMPFREQKEQEQEDKRQIIVMIIVLFVAISVVTAGVILAIGRMRSINPVRSLDHDTAQLVQEVTTISVPETTAPPVTETIQTTVPEETTTAAPETTKPKKVVTYYLNTYRMKFHRPDCDSVYQMNAKNRRAFYGTREEAIAEGYSPCNNCKP